MTGPRTGPGIVLALAATLLAVSSLNAPALAQDYPSRPVKFVLPQPAASSRVTLGQDKIVERGDFEDTVKYLLSGLGIGVEG